MRDNLNEPLCSCHLIEHQIENLYLLVLLLMTELSTHIFQESSSSWSIMQEWSKARTLPNKKGDLVITNHGQDLSCDEWSTKMVAH